MELGLDLVLVFQNIIQLILLIILKNSKLKNQEYKEIKPWYTGFKGDIIKIDDKNYLSKGKYEIINATTLKLPNYLLENGQMIIRNI